MPTKVHIVKAMVFFSSHVWMRELDHKEGWAEKNWCFQTVVLEKTLKSPLDSKEISPKGNQPWIFFGRTDAEAEAPILRPPDVKNWLNVKDSDSGKDLRQEKKGTAEDKTVGWHYQFNGREFEQALGDGKGPGSLACCSPGGGKTLDTTEQLNNNTFCVPTANIQHSIGKTSGLWGDWEAEDGGPGPHEVVLFISPLRTSLVVQWLRLSTSTAGGTGLVLCQGTKIPHATWHGQKKKKKS